MTISADMSRFTRLLRGIVKESTSKAVMREVGENAVEIIKRRTKLGKDVDDKPFKQVSEAYEKRRRKVQLDARATRTKQKSNLIASGQMIDSIEVTDVKARSVEIGAKGGRKKSPLDGGNVSNAEVAYYQDERQGRKFLGLSEKNKQQLQRFYKRIVDKLARKANKKK